MLSKNKRDLDVLHIPVYLHISTLTRKVMLLMKKSNNVFVTENSIFPPRNAPSPPMKYMSLKSRVSFITVKGSNSIIIKEK